MKKEFGMVIIGGLLLLFGGYEIYMKDYMEFAMYLAAGVAFISTALSMMPQVNEPLKKPLTVISWVTIAMAVFLFFYLVRSEAF